MKQISGSVHKWCKVVYASRKTNRYAWAGGSGRSRRWFMYTGSMTRQLRTLGSLQLKVEWFRGSVQCSSGEAMWVRHTYLFTQRACIEAWVWLPWSRRFQERHWFESAAQPVGDILFRRPQRRRFRFFSLPGDSRVFRYSRLIGPKGTKIHLVEAYREGNP